MILKDGVIINGRILTDEEVSTLWMALANLEVDLAIAAKDPSNRFDKSTCNIYMTVLIDLMKLIFRKGD